MGIIKAVKEAERKRELFNQDVHVLKDECGYYTMLDMNFKTLRSNPLLVDKKIQYTAWYIIK